MSTTEYEGIRDERDGVVVYAGRKKLLPARSLLLRNHSPTGFEWGYGGSGPAQLALAILLDYYGDEKKAANIYQDFKWRVIARLPFSGWKLTGSMIEQVVREIERDRRTLAESRTQ
jgi:hypothetical protein